MSWKNKDQRFSEDIEHERESYVKWRNSVQLATRGTGPATNSIVPPPHESTNAECSPAGKKSNVPALPMGHPGNATYAFCVAPYLLPAVCTLTGRLAKPGWLCRKRAHSMIFHAFVASTTSPNYTSPRSQLVSKPFREAGTHFPNTGRCVEPRGPSLCRDPAPESPGSTRSVQCLQRTTKRIWKVLPKFDRVPAKNERGRATRNNQQFWSKLCVCTWTNEQKCNGVHERSPAKG